MNPELRSVILDDLRSKFEIYRVESSVAGYALSTEWRNFAWLYDDHMAGFLLNVLYEDPDFFEKAYRYVGSYCDRKCEKEYDVVIHDWPKDSHYD